MSTETESVAIHDHCLFCITPSKCMACVPSQGCKIIRCHYDCGFLFHMCKLEEHLLLCMKAKVPCLNEHYGCPLWMRRCDIAGHLCHCPASILVCSAQRRRSALGKIAKRTLKAAARSHTAQVEITSSTPPDVAVALSDQCLVVEGMTIPRHIRKKLTTYYSLYYPILPVTRPMSQHDFLPRQDPVTQDVLRSPSYRDSSDDEEEKEKKKYKISPVSRECILCKIDPTSQHLHTIGNQNWASDYKKVEKKEAVTMVDVINPFYRHHGLFLTLTPEFYGGLQSRMFKPKNMFTISCSEVIRRDEFGSHHYDYHQEIICGLDTDIIRCPNASLGCRFWYNRVTPLVNNVRHEVRYNHALDKLNLSQIISTQDTSDNNGVLHKISPDIWFAILDNLDASSLYCLSLTNSFFRYLTSSTSILTSKGIVYRNWVKTTNDDGKVNWILGPLQWSYSKSCSKLSGFEVNLSGKLSNHMAACEYSDPMQHKPELAKVMIDTTIN